MRARAAIAFMKDVASRPLPETGPYRLVKMASIASAASRRESELALKQAQAAVALSNREGLPLWAAIGSVNIACALVQTNQNEKAIVELQHASEAVAAIGSRLSPLHIGAQAEAYGKTGRVAEGLNLLALVIAGVRQVSDGVDEPWLSNLKGKLFLYQDPPDAKEAESCFRTSIELARRIGSKSYELRASINLARLLAKQRHRKQAHAMLAEIYSWFTEGFDTPDLKDARALVEDFNE